MNIEKFKPSRWFKDEENRPALRQNQDSSPWEDFHTEMDKVFDSFFRGVPFASASRLSESMLRPDLDFKATDNDYQVSVELPGVAEKDIELAIQNGTLIISGEKKSEHEEKDKHGLYRTERSYGSFRRMLSLPEDVDADKASADYKNGVLTVSLPRKEAQQKKRISIGRN